MKSEKESPESLKDGKGAQTTEPPVLAEHHKTRPARRKLAVKKKALAPGQKTCLYCHDHIESHEGHAWCPHCKVAMHKDCAEELVSCPTLGCKKDLLNYTPLSIKTSHSDGIGVFGFSPGQVLYYAPSLTLLLAGVILSPSSIAFLFFLSVALFMIDWALGLTFVIDSVVDRFKGRRKKLFIVSAPLFALALIFFFLATTRSNFYYHKIAPDSILGFVFLLEGLLTLLAQRFEPDIPVEPEVLEEEPPSALQQLEANPIPALDPIPADFGESEAQPSEEDKAAPIVKEAPLKN